MNPANLHKVKKEILIDNLEQLNLVYDDVMQQLVMIREELLYRLNKAKKDGEIIGEYQVKKAKRVTFKTSLEEAEELGAVTKAPDTKALRSLYNKGIEVPGVNISEYVSVRKLKQDETE